MIPKKSPLGALSRAAIFACFFTGVNTHAQQPGAPVPPGPPAPLMPPAPLGHGPAAPGQSDVPVHQVVLFSSGVGYFQHEGLVHGDASTQLQFKTAQINDILKSLVLQDLDGGRVGVVTYPSQDPLEKTLGSFQVDISDNPSLGELLNKLRGARVSLSYFGPGGSENFNATVLGVEKRQVPAGKDGVAMDKEFLNLVTDRGIRSLELDKVDRFQLDDPGLQEELNRALAAVAGARDQDKKPVDIRFNGQGDRHVRLGYVVETPIWKASYRLMLPDADAIKEARASGKKTEGSLQGWAIIENQTDNDWNNVRLSLVSGRPISFIQDLYQSLYVPRPTVTPELYSSLQPREYEGGQATKAIQDVTADADASNAKQSANRLRSMSKDRPMPMMAGAAPAPPVSTPVQGAQNETRGIDFSESVSPIGDAAKVGELFQYTVGNVSLARQRSAMIPIINDPVEVEKISIFNESVLAAHPLNGARLKNTTSDEKHLSQGPVTVFDDGRYAGDARLDDVPPGQTRLLSYGIDLQVQVNVKNLEQGQLIQSGKIVKGVLEVTRKYSSAKEYSLDNKSDHDKTVVIEHPLRANWKLVNSPAPVETTNTLYRFQGEVASGKTETVTIHEENVQSQTIELVSLSADYLQFYSRQGEIAAPVRDALVKAISLKQAASETQTLITNHDSAILALTQDQSRIRENLKTVERTSAYATRLLKKLDDQESQLEKMREELDGLHSRLDGQNRSLAAYLEGLNVG